MESFVNYSKDLPARNNIAILRKLASKVLGSIFYWASINLSRDDFKSFLEITGD